ncbi:diacylglycerol kinase family protein [uncultured Ellagibacter sp.]|uniref:diacylglycerol kinase family protein n=1 Tax=uncultured Ellagibacter sp. TaxID=2137580 RepID=UPI002637910A|nr:diacylglycerol kinase family protein [uncultured Ellagibacter sp.]
MTQSLPHAFKCAAEGVAHAFKQRNMRIDACFAVIAIALGFALRIDASSWLAIVICIGMVMAAETVNTAVECVVDLVSPEYHVLAKHAKDCAAGAALILAVASVVIAAIVFIPKIGELLC